MPDDQHAPDLRRPALRWHGGKWRLAPWIIAHFPQHRLYVEPYGGAASVLLRKPRAYGEVYNDLDDEVVNLFRVLQDPGGGARLIELLRVTPFARAEFKLSYQMTDDPVERARRLVIRSYMGFGSNAHASGESGHRSTGFRANSDRSGTTPAQDWANYPPALAAIVDRVAGVVIECRDAIAVMAQHDGPETLHYVDPPYVWDTRSPGNKYDVKYRMYRHELNDDDHRRLLGELKQLGGMVVLSGYRAAIYDDALDGWQRREIDSFADGARPRTECLWLNPACVEALGHGPLFDAPASA
jgi:DNA adenine methylase